MRRLDSDRQFRAGSFSFEAISQMPFSEIKIDRSLVEGCGTVATNANICKTNIQIAHNFGCRAAAVGVVLFIAIVPLLIVNIRRFQQQEEQR